MTVAIVPIRSLTGGKTRLASVLSVDERRDLIKSMLMQVTRAALDSGMLARALVISADQDALDFAASLDPRVLPVRQNSTPGLVASLDQARAAAVASGSRSALILFGDLPLIEAIDVRLLMRHDAPVVIAPDQRGAGTNALLLRDGALADFAFQFGAESFGRHMAEAARLGVSPAISRSPGTLFDLDTPEDWRVLSISPASIVRGESVRALLQEATPR